MIIVHNVGLYPATMLSQETLELRDNLKGLFDFRHLMHRTGNKNTFTLYKLSIKWSKPFLYLKILKRYHILRQFYQINLNWYKFAVSPSILKMVDHILKISRPGVFDFRCINWKTAIIVFMKKCPMKRRRYKRNHWISMFIGTPCIIISSPLFLFNNTLSPKTLNSIQWKFKQYILSQGQGNKLHYSKYLLKSQILT